MCIVSSYKNKDQSLRCKGRAIYKTEEQVVKETGIHNHPPDANAKKVQQMRNEIKNEAASTSNSTREIMQHSSIALQEEAEIRNAMPNEAALKRMTQRKRVEVFQYPKEPTHVDEIKLEGRFLLNKVGKKFVHFDGAVNGSRMIIFATDEDLQFLHACPHWFVDATFKSAPKLFKQMFTIHGNWRKISNMFFE